MPGCQKYLTPFRALGMISPFDAISGRRKRMESMEGFNSRAVGRRIRALREKIGMSQKELTVRSGIPQSQLSRIENGTRPIRPVALAALALALGVRTDELLKDVMEDLRGPKPAA
jgi:ribosome-binding protein aMBF1 (putative translation factor)